jgi:hypothetical protein
MSIRNTLSLKYELPLFPVSPCSPEGRNLYFQDLNSVLTFRMLNVADGSFKKYAGEQRNSRKYKLEGSRGEQGKGRKQGQVSS